MPPRVTHGVQGADWVYGYGYGYMAMAMAIGYGYGYMAIWGTQSQQTSDRGLQFTVCQCESHINWGTRSSGSRRSDRGSQVTVGRGSHKDIGAL